MIILDQWTEGNEEFRIVQLQPHQIAELQGRINDEWCSLELRGDHFSRNLLFRIIQLRTDRTPAYPIGLLTGWHPGSSGSHYGTPVADLQAYFNQAMRKAGVLR